MACTGRRPGEPPTRDHILAAARRAFAERGYAAASVRDVARRAGVDPALVAHYFGSKRGLFVAATDFPADPAAVIARVVEGPRDQVGERLLRTILAIWDDAVLREPVVALVRAAAADEQSAAIVREFFTTEVLDRLTRELNVDHASLRGGLVATQLLGLVISRYIVRIEPISSAPADALVAAIAPAIQRYLTGPLEPLQESAK